MIDMTEQGKEDFAKRLEMYGLKDFNNELGFWPLYVGKAENTREQSFIQYEYHAKPSHRNVFGSIHGGVIASLCDACIGQGAAMLRRRSMNTINLNITYLEPCIGDNYRIDVEYTHSGIRIVDALAKVYDLDNKEKLCAYGAGSFIVLDKRPDYLTE